MRKGFKIATWNVNSIRVRLDAVCDWIREHDPDVIALQETKIVDKDFPKAVFESLGYQVVTAGQPTYSGVAILSKHAFSSVASDELLSVPSQARLLKLVIGNTAIFNVYVPNGAEVDSEKYHYKLAWLKSLSEVLSDALLRHASVMVLGDFNIAPADADVYDPKAFEGQLHASAPERDALKNILDLGFQDVFRCFEQPAASYSWWDYRRFAFKRNHGLRIDLILASHSLCLGCQSVFIDKTPRKAERPSDHVPVIAIFDEIS